MAWVIATQEARPPSVRGSYGVTRHPADVFVIPADAGISVGRTALHRAAGRATRITSTAGERRRGSDLDIGDWWRETCSGFML